MSGEGLRRASSASSRDSALIFQIRNIRQLLSSPYETIRACWARPKTSHAGGGGGGDAYMFSAALSASHPGRSEERRDRKECVRTCRSWRYSYKKKHKIT